jgi:hypothetical protein
MTLSLSTKQKNRADLPASRQANYEIFLYLYASSLGQDAPFYGHQKRNRLYAITTIPL